MSVYKSHKSESYVIDFTYFGPDGRPKRYRKSAGRGVNKRDAEQMERALAKEYRRGHVERVIAIGMAPGGPKPVPFSGLAKRWFDNYVVVRNRLSVQRTTEQIIRVHLVRHFGDKDANAISRCDIDDYVAVVQRKGLKPKTINNHLGVLSRMLACALEWDLVGANPLKGYKPLKVDEKESRWLAADEATSFLTAAAEHDPGYYHLFYTALATGMRQGELLGLKWPAVDFDRNQIRVVSNRVLGQDGTPKNGRIRTIKMNGSLSELLYGLSPKEGYVFCRENGDPLTPDMVKRPFWRALRNASLPKIRFHDLRHSFASQLVTAGVQLQVVQELLGHADLKMTMRYAHLSPSVGREAVEKLTFGGPVLMCVDGIRLGTGSGPT